MRNLRTIFLNRILALVLTIVALMTGQEAWAESSWTVTNSNGSSNTFTIKRSEKGYEQTVHFRTISLSAYAGQHFTAVNMDYTFLDNEDEKTVTVTEMNPSTNAYKYQTGASRKYGFEVLDRAGFRLAYAERSKTWGTSVTSSGIFGVKSIDVGSGETTVTDDGYINNSYRTMAGSDYYDNAAPKAWLSAIGATLHMTLSMKVKEVNDGYQYIQVLFDNTSSCDDRSKCSDGNPGNINLSRYMAGFGHNPGSYDGNWSTYTFPVTSRGNNCGTVSNPWGNTIDAKLYDQKFGYDSYRDTDGKLIIPTEFTTLVLRLNASGNNEDNWTCKDVTAKIQAIDATAPTKFAVSVAPGRHSKGNTVYVSVAFTEIVTSSSPKLTSNWGNLTYVDGSGTNVLTFCTTIPQDATGDLNITGFSGTIQDLAGNSLSGGVTASSICTLDNDFAYIIDDFQKDGDNYLIKTHEDLIGLAGYVNGGGATKGKTFLQVADIVFPHTTNWNNANSTENNYTAIGTNKNPFLGTFDGQGYTVSGIRIYRGGTSNSDSQGLFGAVKNGGTVKRVTLSDARITGYCYVGGIAARTYYSSIEDCTVDANVCIHAVQSNAYDYGGIVGYNQAGPVNRCISRATLTVANSSGCKDFGGIVGLNMSNNITDCIAEGVVIPDVNARGAIVGHKEDFYGSTLTRNYYHDCKVASNSVTHSGVGMGTEGSKTTSDADGAQPLWAITLPNHASVVRTGTAFPGTDNATYDNGADINGVPYAKGLSVVNLSYDPATITEGYDVLMAVKKTSNNTAVTFTDNGDYTYTIASMPAADITVSVTEIPIIAYIDADGNPQSHACTPIVEGTTSYQTLGRTEGWYVVNSDVTFNNQTVKFLDQTVHVILCDGAHFSINSGDFSSLEVPNGSLEILAQSNGSGELVLRSSGSNALVVEINKNRCIDINGGNIRIYDGTYGIFAVGGTVTIRRGTVSISGRNDGIWASNIILGCSNVNDRIYAKTYNGTVTIADGQILSDGTATYSGKLTNDEIAEIAGKRLSTAIPYIDADGTTKYKASKDLTFITTSTRNYGNADNAEGWYCVNSDVDFSSIVTFKDQQANIILCDGFTLNSNTTKNECAISAVNGSLTIYGQTLGTGTLTACSKDYSAISSINNIDINGGAINATSSYYNGLYAQGNVTIRRGNIKAKGYSNAYGIKATTITLGCPTTADRIYATSYYGTVVVADGQTLTDGNSAHTYIGTLTDTQKNAIKKETMMKALGDVSYIDENGQEQICNNYKILSDGILTATLNSIGNTVQDTWYVASGNYTFNATYLRTNGRVHIILCDGASFTVNGSDNYGIYATGNLTIYGQSQGTGTLTANVANASGKALYVYYCNLVVNGGVVNANGGEYGIYIDKGKLTVNGGSINCSDNKGLYVNGDALMGSPLLAHHMPQYDIKGLLSVKLTMNSIGIMTYSGVNSLDFTNVSGLSAYVALSDADGNGNITLTRTYKPAGLTGMVLCGEPSASYIVPTVKDKDPDYYQNNLLRHVIEATEIDKTDGIFTNYILAKKNGNVGFYPLSGKGTLKAYSAYLQLRTKSSSRGLVLNFEEEGTPTGVGHTEITEGLARRPAGESQSTEMADAIYDLQGRRIEKPKKGLYIVNGKKVLVH